jgi:hypothetical protein
MQDDEDMVVVAVNVRYSGALGAVVECESCGPGAKRALP